MPARETEADGPAPVLDHQRQVAEAELVDEAFEHGAVFARCEPVAGRCGRHAVAGEVERDATELVLQAGDDLPVEERPGRVSVQDQDRLARARARAAHGSPESRSGRSPLVNGLPDMSSSRRCSSTGSSHSGCRSSPAGRASADSEATIGSDARGGTPTASPLATGRAGHSTQSGTTRARDHIPTPSSPPTGRCCDGSESSPNDQHPVE